MTETAGSGDDGGTAANDRGGEDDVASTGGPTSGEAATDDTTGDVPVFHCDPVPTSSPVLDGVVVFDPAEPHPGDTLSVIVRAGNGLGHGDAPPMDLEVQSAAGTEITTTLMRAGGAALYYYAIPDISAGDVCVRGLIDGAPEVSARIEVTPRPPGLPVDGGIYKIVTNHQWTCGEQPGFGNELHVWVREDDGTPIAGVPVSIRPADSTDLGSIYNGDGEPIPEQIVTGDDGHATAYVYWPISDNGLLVLQVQVAGAASDIATEITTGWWETDDDGCNYCGIDTVNVWGHWSHTVEFVRDASATEVCVVETDHAGQVGCGPPGHVLHHPDARACWVP